MVCLQEEGSVKVTIQDAVQQQKPSHIHITSSKTIEEIFKEISEKYECTPEELDIVFKAGGKEVTLNEHKDKTFYEAGFWPVPGENDYELIVNRVKNENYTSDNTFWGASASPTTCELVSSACEEYAALEFTYASYSQNRRRAQNNPVIDMERYLFTVESPNYVGLVNQAMTCYLNSLLQALFMTPEFRNALYNWEFDGVNETRSIPFQLQKLFLNLQTSTKSAVETTDLTTSFGWQGSDAWHQHDIQELCRVMFDALEQKFKDTKQANLINDLYEGKMLDYVKCLECQTEKSREDTFLDIPLPVRPFGSSVAYTSVEEALRAFVQPETLDGNNQYFCEKCNKKVDAHKGLKFIKFPYLLTLHLKRFDFDYNTMHRIKLNDKVVFPEKLNLNSFIPPVAEEEAVSHSSRKLLNEHTDDAIVKCDDCSTTDSGSADDESCQGTDMSSTLNGQDDNCADSDEGIDVSSGTNHHEIEAKGPYLYELFSIMIHSGSASGGHYYAYIKDFDKNLWYCFNDQSVSPITEDDIKKSFGGGPQRGYYSGVYSSSTNAYMLMYRQIDKDRNSRAMTVNEFPPHIQKLLHDMRLKEEQDRLNRKKEDEMVKISVRCIHPSGNMVEVKISTFTDSTLGEVAQHAYSRFKLDGLVDIKDCRIVVYNKIYHCIDRSYESDDLKLLELVTKFDIMCTDWMLEIREPGTPWKTYKEGGINVKVYPVNIETEDIDEARLVRVDVDETLGELKKDLGDILDMEPSTLKVVFEMHGKDPKYFRDDNEVIKFNLNCSKIKFFVASIPDKDPDTNHKNLLKLKTVVEMFQCIISLNVVLPDTDEGTLESLSIPSLDLNQNVDKHVQSGERDTSSPSLRVSPQPGAGGMCGDGYDQSNSEDSSLSDSDRTLIGDAPECVAVLSSSSPSPADQHMVSPSDPCQDIYNMDVMGRPGEEMHWDYSETQNDSHNYFFKITSVMPYNDPMEGWKATRCCKVLVDKRMNLEMLKKHLESILRVPSEYFKVYKEHTISEEEWSRLSETLRCVKDGEKLTLKLGKVLSENEHHCKVYHFKVSTMDLNCFLMEHILTKGQTVGAVKKDIINYARKHLTIDIPQNKCRLREKGWKKPTKVYLDDKKFGSDIILNIPFEMYIQELTESETVTSDNQFVVFIRKFSPSTLTLGPFQEVVIDLVTTAELKNKISAASDIPVDYVDVAYDRYNQPCDTHLLEIYEDLEWNPTITNLSRWTLHIEDGSMFYYKDSREVPKDLTPVEKKEIKQKEDARLGRLSIKTYSPGRERALKIYLDTSPSKSEDSID